MSDSARPPLNRRHVLGGAAVLGVAPLLAACGEDNEPPATTGAAPESGASSPTGRGGAGSGRSGGSADPSAGLVAADDVPVGGGVILDEQPVVVTQPAEGEFKAFSAICTHQGCPVQSVAEGKILCPCHGSEFSVADGSVLTGPATSPLEEIGVAVEGGQVVEA